LIIRVYVGFYVLVREINWDKYHVRKTEICWIKNGIKVEAKLRERGEINFKARA